MADFKMILILGSYLERIRFLIEQLENLYFGLFVTNLYYENKEEGIKKKKEYFNNVKGQVLKTNKKIRDFNRFLKSLFNTRYFKFERIEKIDLDKIKSIIDNHKGDYPQERRVGSTLKFMLARDESASSLSRKHTAQLLSNTLLPVKLSLSNFAKNLDKLTFPFKDYEELGLPSNVEREIRKAEESYSIGLPEEAVFILGRLVDKLTRKCLLLLKKKKRVPNTYKEINEMSFENRLNILSSNKLNFFSEDQKAKALAIKWDRNIYGHGRLSTKKMSEKDADAIIKIGINTVKLLDSKINKLKIN